MDMCSYIVATVKQDHHTSHVTPTDDTRPNLHFTAESSNIQCASLPDHSTFLALPAEIRIAIYEETILTHLPALALLQTNRQIAIEGRPILYQRHLTFQSQARLFDWIERSRSTNLKRVRTLTVRLSDIDLSPLFGTQRRTRTSAWSLYQEEIDKLNHAFTMLPSVSELTVTPPQAGHSQLLRGMYFSFLALVPRLYPGLKRLTVDDTEGIVESVPSLTQLSSICFSVAVIKAEQDPPDKKHDSPNEKHDWPNEKHDSPDEKHDSAASLSKQLNEQDTHTIRKGRKRAAPADDIPKAPPSKRRAQKHKKLAV